MAADIYNADTLVMGRLMKHVQMLAMLDSFLSSFVKQDILHPQRVRTQLKQGKSNTKYGA